MNAENTEHIISTTFGYLKLKANSDALTGCDFLHHDKETRTNSPILKTASAQLKAYFEKKLKIFDVPLAPEGSDFQKNVWDALLQIPYGEKCSYRDIAIAIGNPKATRAVGSANGKNPLCVFIPCHRVIRASGHIGGYSGGIIHKETLLQLESA